MQAWLGLRGLYDALGRGICGCRALIGGYFRPSWSDSVRAGDPEHGEQRSDDHLLHHLPHRHLHRHLQRRPRPADGRLARHSVHLIRSVQLHSERGPVHLVRLKQYIYTWGSQDQTGDSGAGSIHETPVEPECISSAYQVHTKLTMSSRHGGDGENTQELTPSTSGGPDFHRVSCDVSGAKSEPALLSPFRMTFQLTPVVVFLDSLTLLCSHGFSGVQQ